MEKVDQHFPCHVIYKILNVKYGLSIYKDKQSRNICMNKLHENTILESFSLTLMHASITCKNV